jgi:hypothetical protein
VLFFGSNSSNQFVIGHGLFEGVLSASKFNTILSSSIFIVVSMFQNVFCLSNSYGKEKKLTFHNFFHASSFGNTCATSISIIVCANYERLQVPTFKFLLLENQQKKKGRTECDIQRMLKDMWATKFPWVKLVVDFGWEIHMVHYKACLVVEGKEKKINLKFNGLLKPIHKQRSFLVHPISLIGEYYKLALITNIKRMKMLMPPMVKSYYE